MSAEGLAKQAECLERLPALLRSHKKQAPDLLALANELRRQALRQCAALAVPSPCAEAFARLADAVEAAAVNNV